MSGGHELQLDLCAARALGSIDAQDRRVLEEHLAGGCPECLAFLRDASGPIEALALSLPPAVPSRGLKARVMVAVARRPAAARDVGGEVTAPARRVRARLVPALPAWGWTLVALLLVAAGVGWWRAGVLTERVGDLEARAAGTPESSAARDAFRRRHPQAREIVLVAQAGADPARSARVLYDAASRRALVLLEGFAAPVGRDFELWTVRGGTPSSEGLLQVDAASSGLRVIENVGDPARLSGFLISLEPAGGAADRERPTMVHYRGF